MFSILAFTLAIACAFLPILISFAFTLASSAFKLSLSALVKSAYLPSILAKSLATLSIFACKSDSFAAISSAVTFPSAFSSNTFTNASANAWSFSRLSTNPSVPLNSLTISSLSSALVASSLSSIYCLFTFELSV